MTQTYKKFCRSRFTGTIHHMTRPVWYTCKMMISPKFLSFLKNFDLFGLLGGIKGEKVV